LPSTLTRRSVKFSPPFSVRTQLTCETQPKREEKKINLNTQQHHNLETDHFEMALKRINKELTDLGR
jgi:hypothetical protein